MNDLFNFMKNKETKSVQGNVEQKNNNSIYAPVGFFDDTEVAKKETTKKVEYKPNHREEIDFYNINRMKEEDQLIELTKKLIERTDEIKRLENEIDMLRQKINEIQIEKNRFEWMYSEYKNVLIKIIRFLPYFKTIEFSGIGYPEDWKDRQLVELFVKSIEDISYKYKELLKSYETDKAKWENQIALLLSQKRSETKIEPVAVKESMGSEIEIDEMEIQVEEPVIEVDDVQISDNVDESFDLLDRLSSSSSMDLDDDDYSITLDVEPQAQSQTYVSETMDKYIEKMSDSFMKVILKAIGETGLSRVTDFKEMPDVQDIYMNKSNEFNQAVLSQKLQSLVDMSMLDKETINIKRRGGQEYIYSLTDTGSLVYKAIFGKDAEESEKFKIMRQHSSLEHGYFIKTIAKEMRTKGYEVQEDPKECQVQVTNGEKNFKVEADLIAKKNKETYIIECEMGTTDEADMGKKLDKLILASKVISFMMPNNDAMNTTSHKVDKWITKMGGAKNLKGYCFRFSTIDMLKKNDIWQNKGPF